MPSLREIQARCRQAFVAGDSDALSGLLQAHDELPVIGIDVYRNNARETFRLALAASYPVIEGLVGAGCFAGLASKYVESHPSSEPDLQSFGEQFPGFLDRYYSDSPYRYLADVARLELATEQVLLQRERVPLDAGRLASLPGTELPELRLVASPASRLVSSDFPILEIWRTHYRAVTVSVPLDAGPNHVLVLRSAGDAVLRSLSALEFMLADRLSHGESIGSAFESLSSVSSMAAVQSALAKLLGYRVFTDIH